MQSAGCCLPDCESLSDAVVSSKGTLMLLTPRATVIH